MVELRKVGQRIHAKIPYADGDGPRRAKRVHGASWSKPSKRWTYPLSIEVCRMLRAEFGQELRVHSSLADWARDAVARERSQIELRSANTADLATVPVAAPKLYAAMEDRPFQKVGARFIADGRTVLIADDPGLGKTLEALGGLIEVGARYALVFAKLKAAETVWGAEVPRWLGDKAEVYVAKGAKAQRDKTIAMFFANRTAGIEDDKLRILVCNIEMARIVRLYSCTFDPICNGKDQYCPHKANHICVEEPKFPQLFDCAWDAIVVDESHKALIGKHTRSNSITQVRLGMMKLEVEELRGVKIALSGTPFRGKTENAWGTLNWLAPKVWTSYWRFVDSYFDVTENEFGGREINGLRPDALDAYDRALAPYVLRRTKAEVASDLPPRMYGGTPLNSDDPQSTTGVWMEMEPAQAKVYQQIHDEGEVALESGTLMVNGALAELTRRKQLADCAWDVTGEDPQTGKPILHPRRPSNKYNWLLEFIEERAAAGQKVVVASQFTKVLNAFSAWLRADGVESYLLTGETSPSASMANVAAFNDPADSVPAFLLNTMAGGESINLDACADDAVFLDETFIPDDQEQVENRIHRLSRIHQVNIWYLRSLDTVDESICRITGARDAIVKGRLDGVRGINTLRSLLEAK